MNTKRLNIFLADDDSDDRDFFEIAAQVVSADIEVSLFANGQLLCDYLERESATVPDILFLDINMPLKNGFQCLQAIRSSDKLNDLCIIMYSTSSNQTDINKSYELGASGFVQKPFNFNDLKGLLQRVCDTDWKNPSVKVDQLNFVLKPR